MTDDQLLDQLHEYVQQGPSAGRSITELLKAEGGISRLDGIITRLRAGLQIGKIRKPRTPRQKPDSEPEGFADWYAAYPRHKARDAASKAYRAALKQADAETLLAGARRYRAGCTGLDPKLIAHPATWLNAGRWKDEEDRPLLAAVSPMSETPAIWLQRLEVFYGLVPGQPKGTWPARWRGKPGTPECECPPEALALFEQKYGWRPAA